MPVQTLMPDDGGDLSGKLKKLLAEKEALEKQLEVLEERQKELAADQAKMGLFDKKSR